MNKGYKWYGRYRYMLYEGELSFLGKIFRGIDFGVEFLRVSYYKVKEVKRIFF